MEPQMAELAESVKLSNGPIELSDDKADSEETEFFFFAGIWNQHLINGIW